MARTPEIQKILDQVEADLTAIRLADEVGTVTVHCGRSDMYVETTSKRKHDPVVIQQERRLAVIQKAR